MGKLTQPEQLNRPGLTAEERAAYAMTYSMSEEARRHREEDRLRGALAHAGAELKDFVERQDVYTITYTVDGQRQVLVQHVRVVAGVFLGGERVQLTADRIDLLRDLHRRAVLGSLEQQVFKVVRGTRAGRLLVPGADPDPDPHRRGPHPGDLLGDHP